MRVAMVSEHASPLAMLGGADAGGQNVYVAELARALARRGAVVTVYTRRDGPALPRRVELAPGVTVVHVDAGPARELPKDRLLPHMPAFADELSLEWTDERPDVVHAHFWMSGMAALEAAAPIGIPVVQTFHALGVVKRRHHGESDTSPPERLDVERRIMRCASRILATCTDEVFELVRQGADARRITVVPCGVDLTHFRPGVRAWERPSGTPRVVSIGRLVERKGVGDLVAALASVPGAELLIAGGPDADGLEEDGEARRLRSCAREHGVEDRVTLLGRLPRDDVPALLCSADAVVCVPWYEPFGIVPLEAMACGVPIVASAVGGMIDTVVDGVTGVHVAPRRPAALASALRGLLGDSRLRAKLGAAGVRRARERYGWDRVGAATHEVYWQLADRTASSTRTGVGS